MKAIFRHSNYKLQWFEWTMLLLSFGVILEAIHFAKADFTNSKHPSGTGHHFEINASTTEKTGMVNPDPWRQLAEEALLFEMTTEDSAHDQRNWTAYGIPADELAFLEYWHENLLDTALLDADGRLVRMLQARDLYQSVGDLMQQQMVQEDFFARMENLYRIPADRARWHYYQQRPSTAGQWATFVAQHKSE